MSAANPAAATSEAAEADFVFQPDALPFSSVTSHSVVPTAGSRLNTELELERIVLGGLLCFGRAPFQGLCLEKSDFACSAYGDIWAWLHSNPSAWIAGATNVLAHQTSLSQAGLTDALASGGATAFELVQMAEGLGTSGVAHYAGTMVAAAIHRARRALAAQFADGRIFEEEYAALNHSLDLRTEFLEGRGSSPSLLVELDQRRYRFSEPPARPEPLFTIGSHVIATPGNIVVIAAQAKAGKSAYLAAMMAAAMNPAAADVATLGVRSRGASGGAIIHFDTEQSTYDHFALVSLALQRAGLEQSPDILRSYCVADCSIEHRLGMLRAELARAGDVFAVFLDGVADFVRDPNNTEEAFTFVAELHRLAIRHSCVFVAVLHENPGSGEYGKTRGHLGSQLERKAETNLRLSKTDGITTVWTDRGARHCHIPKDLGTRFEYSAAQGRHVLAERKSEERERTKKEEMLAIALSVFEGANSPLSWAELRSRIMQLGGFADSTARKHIKTMTKLGVIGLDISSRYEFRG
jgi:hypothetical protein